MFPRSITGLLPLLLAAPVAADVLVVAPVGAPYTTPQQAIDAAVDGDTILVRAGTYDGFWIVHKSVAVIADPERSVRLVSQVVVFALEPSQAVTLSGFEFHRGRFGGMWLAGNRGAVRLVALRALPPLASDQSIATAIDVGGCDDVALLRCELDGGASTGPFPSAPGSALGIQDSRVALYDCDLVGGSGADARWTGVGNIAYPPQLGEPGAIVRGASQVFASGVSFTGGEGGDGVPANCTPFVAGGGNGAAGGAGLVIEVGAMVLLQGSTTMGGAGGAAGASAPACGAPGGNAGPAGPTLVGQTTLVAGPARRLRAATHVREQQPLRLEFTGLPGERAFLQLGLDTQWSLEPALGGVRLVGNTSRRAFLGTIPAGGVLQVSVPINDLGPGVESLWNHLQAFLIDGSNTIHLGGAQEVVLLDAAF
jgi:hypothetical protein